MKKTLRIVHILLYCLLLFAACENEQEYADNPPLVLESRWESKEAPNDHLLLQRSFPDPAFDANAYQNALKAAKNQMQQRTGTGFNGTWRTEGPGNIGGRINCVAVHPSNSDIIFIGYSHGGVWRTINGGNEWIPIFDDQISLSISEITIDANNPEHIWVGTGDVNISGTPFIGDGVYKSEDGGDTWSYKGLIAQRIVSKIVIDPNDSDRVYVGTMGIPFERNEERGLYRTLDGGDTWEQVLFVADQAGICDLVMDPFNPQTLYASAWDRIRNNFESLIRGPNARIFKSIDGGDTWTALEGGLPVEDDMGRTGLAISQKTPNLLYAMYVGNDQQLFGVYRSEDGGVNWTAIPIDEDANGLNSNALGGFGWYFGKLRVHPEDDNDIFLLGVDLWRSTIGTDFWNMSTPPWWEYSVHADKHDLIFTHDGQILLATDGGLYRSSDNGASWEDIENIPATQFYRVAYNPHNTDWYYGGAQDNGTTGGNAGMINEWPRIWGGDGFQTVFHPTDPNIFYVETQRGNITGTDDGGAYNWFPADDGIENGDRRNWDMPYMMSHHLPEVMYAGTYRMYRSTAGTYPNYEPISEMLTDSIGPPPDRAANHTISTLHESPLNASILYVGTTDGKVWRTLDGGDNWENITAGLPNRYVTDIKASPFQSNVVYVSHSGYKDNDFIPHLHRSEDHGDTWVDISSDLPQIAINDVYVLPNQADTVLFAGTDAGVYGTLNAGETWERVGQNMPIIPIFDLEYNVAKNELIAGTYSRSIMTYSIDSLLFMEIDTVTSTANQFQLPIHQLKVYPSPAVHEITVELLNNEFGKAVDLLIIDMKGQVVAQRNVQQQGQIMSTFDVSNLPTGNYFVKAKIRNRVLSGRFVKH